MVLESEWEKTENGGWSHKPQQMKWKDILNWQVEMFLYSCYLYYELDKPKLSDEHFDRLVDILEAHYNELPEQIRQICDGGKIKPAAHAMVTIMTDKQKDEAMEWGSK